MDIKKTIESIKENIIQGRNSIIFYQNIPLDKVNEGKNEFLFFIKPEITLNNDRIKLSDILQFIFSKFDEFSLNVKNIRVINAGYLAKHKLISQHYGVINQLSSDIRKYISLEAKNNFESLYNEAFENANVLGSIELLEKYPYLSPTALSILWQNSPTEKLAGGTYVQKLVFDGSTVYLVNGFHPRQLEHFTAPERTIVVMTLTSNTDWTFARNQLIGKTNPQDALNGSIRKELLNRKDDFGLLEISSSWNGVHLSAGPIEGLVELIRYNSNLESGPQLKANDYNFGKDLIEAFGEKKCLEILKNPNIIYKGKSISVFDLTEEMNTDECIDRLKECVFE